MDRLFSYILLKPFCLHNLFKNIQHMAFKSTVELDSSISAIVNCPLFGCETEMCRFYYYYLALLPWTRLSDFYLLGVGQTNPVHAL